jgi:adenylosuccinate synthase
VCDLKHPDTVAAHVRENVMARNKLIPGPHLEWQEVLDQLLALGERLKPMIADTSAVLVAAMREGRHVMFEGAQGTMLDIDHGTYPFVTSSNGTAGGVCTGLGVPPRAVNGVLGVAKAYTTRVGAGPLPTELHDDIGHRLRESGQEYGASTGRPRRCGWYDAVAVRYAARINGLDALAVTKLDVLDGLDRLEICTGYRRGDVLLTDFPADLQLLEGCEPVYETMPGWNAPTRGVRRFADLPDGARAYVRRLEEVSGVPAAIISTGSDREDTIIRDDSVVAAWFGASVSAG